MGLERENSGAYPEGERDLKNGHPQERELYPIGIQTFTKIREGGYVYVDKTRYVAKLAKDGGYYFLSRPRRFGKSLLISTLECYFEGKREYFRGLAIDSMDIEWTQNPVVHLDFNSKNYDSVESLKEMLGSYLLAHEEKFGIEQSNAEVDERFFRLIKEVHKQTGKRVVVLVDEYDKPLLSVIDNDELQARYQAIMKGFYGVLKSADRYLQFVMLTGVTRFGKVSVFSDLNNLRDISMEEGYDAICGITDQELHKYFQSGVERLASKRNISLDEAYGLLKYNYDGYHFSERLNDIYNPFSILNSLAKSEIANYWFETGTPTFLLSLIKNENLDLSRLNGEIEYYASDLLGVMVTSQDAVPLLYQSGYLTIKRRDDFFKTVLLGYPNHEVEDSFIKVLLPYYSSISKGHSIQFINDLVRYIMSGDVDGFMSSLRSLLAQIPMHSHDEKLLELHYHNMMYLISRMVGLYVHTEYQTSVGRIDMVIETPNYIYVMEFKVDVSPEVALKQINDRNYTLPFKTDGRKILKIGASFSNETRTISSWVVETE